LERKGSFFILLIIIAILTLIIAVLATFIIVVGVNGPQKAVSEERETSKSDDSEDDETSSPTPTVIDENLLSTVKLFSERTLFNLKTDEGKTAALMADVTIKYINKMSGIKDVTAKISANEDNLKEIVSNYFNSLTFDDVTQLETKLQAKEDLKAEMNRYLISTIENEGDRKKVKEIVYEVVFSGWNYQR